MSSNLSTFCFLPFGQYNGRFVRDILTVLVLIAIIVSLPSRRLEQWTNSSIFHVNHTRLDFWSATHFAFYAYLGMRYPNHPAFFILMGIGWEIIEDYLATNDKKIFVDCSLCKNKGKFHQYLRKVWCNNERDLKIFARFSDIAVNTLGYVAGSYFFRQFLCQ